jgi:hypothetical protein
MMGMKPSLIFILIVLGVAALMYIGLSVLFRADTSGLHRIDHSNLAGFPLG